MPDLYVSRAMPNPRGKDRAGQTAPSNDQLNEEWIEFTNTTVHTIALAGVSLLNQTYNVCCQPTAEQTLTTFASGELPANYSIRMHTGSGIDRWEQRVFLSYLGKSNFVWNNACGDIARLALRTGQIDQAWYAGNPPERILRRIPGTNQLL